jgi:hypothetical protein
MPITVTAPRGVLTAEGEREILPWLTEALLEAGGVSIHGGRGYRSVIVTV